MNVPPLAVALLSWSDALESEHVTFEDHQRDTLGEVAFTFSVDGAPAPEWTI